MPEKHDHAVRHELCDEAIRLGRVLVGLMPDEAEAHGLLALMLLHHSSRDEIEEGLALAARAGDSGLWALRAQIAGEHARARHAADTDWPRIAALHGALAEIAGSPVVELNRAVAIAMAEGPERGLEAIDRLAAEGSLDGYHLLHSARGEVLWRMGGSAEAAAAYRDALALATNPVERQFLARRLSDSASGAEL